MNARGVACIVAVVWSGIAAPVDGEETNKVIRIEGDAPQRTVNVEPESLLVFDGPDPLDVRPVTSDAFSASIRTTGRARHGQVTVRPLRWPPLLHPTVFRKSSAENLSIELYEFDPADAFGFEIGQEEIWRRWPALALRRMHVADGLKPRLV
jgi:hypothetical protein